MNNLDTVRARVTRLLLLFLWAHVPAVLVHGWWAESDIILEAVLIVSALSGLATLAVKFLSPPRLGRMVIGTTMTLTAAVLVAIYEGHAWQKDVHLYFATVIALLSATFCWRTLTTALATTILYFLVVGLTMPALLYGAEGSLLEAGFELIAFAVLAAGLLWMSHQVHDLFMQVEEEQSLAKAETQKALEAGTVAEAAAAEAKEAAIAAEQAKEEAVSLRQQQAEVEARQAAEKKEMLDGLAADFEGSVQHIVGQVAAMARGMKDVASDLQIRARTGITSAGNIRLATENASADVASVSGAATELSGSTSEIAQQIDQTNRLTTDAVAQSADVADRISLLSERANEIGSVVALITEIAEQTNLLALNATIEAARAGEVGKGFAVVASEVKSLAGQSARAAEGIHERIGAVQAATDSAVQAMNAINEVITSINVGATAIAAAVEEQDAATRDIANSVRQASDETRAAADNAKAVEGDAQQSEEATASVLQSIDQLEELAEKLNAHTDSFLAQVRSSA